MWNGFWKLTAMVGVIGVGLFAVYQAQKGIRLPLVNIKSDADTADATDPEPGSEAEDELPEVRREESKPTVVGLFDADAESSASPSQRLEPDELAPLKDVRGDRGTKQIAATKAIAKGKQGGQILPVKRVGVDFNKDAAPAETESTAFSDEPTTLPSEAAADDPKEKEEEAKEDDTAEPAKGGDPTAETESESADPFSEEPSSGKTQLDAATESEMPADDLVKESPVAEPPELEKPGRTQISSEFDSDPPPPRSNRAKRKTEKRTEMPSTEDADPFGGAPDATPPKSRNSVTEPVTEDRPTLGPPSGADDAAKPFESKSEGNDTRIEKAKELPAELDLPTEENTVSSGSVRSKGRNSLPAPLPAVLPESNLDDLPTKKRDPANRRTNYDAVTQTDMIGDGDIGDPSQRGLQQPRLTIEKIAQQQAVLGQPLIYTIVVKNIGSVDAHNVVIEDRIPKGTELKGTSPQAELSGKRLIWNQPLLRPNEEKKISIKVVPHQEGPIGSVARVHFATEVSTEIVVAAPQLDFTIKAPREVRMGQRFDMVFLLKNIGKVDATNVVVRDIVPESLKNEAGNDIECPVGKLAPNESREIVLTVTAIKTGTVLNQTIVTADSSVRKSYENEIDINGEVLVLTRSGQNQLYVERSAVFTNNIRNEGNQRADRVRISEIVPAGMQFETASDGGKFDPQARAVVWTLGPLAPGSDRSVTVKYVPKETGMLASNITATGNLGSTATVNASVKVIGKPELQMETLSATGIVTVGDRTTYRFQLTNNGTAPANNVQLRVQLPRELKLISVRGGKAQQDGEFVIFEPIAELTPKTKASFELLLEPTDEADAQIGLEIAADHLSKPGRRIESIQIARDALK